MDGETEFSLWPGTPPGGAGLTLDNRSRDFGDLSKHHPERASDRIGRPFVTLFRPAAPNGSAVLLLPGGGYGSLWFDKEGNEVAHDLNAAGIAGFVLQYRLPGEGWAGRANVPLQDAQRAMRLIRMHAGTYGINAQKVGVMGFSAGGHLAASLATRFDAKLYEAVDDADRLDARPAFAALLYPVVTMGAGTHSGSRDNLLGPAPTPEMVAAASCERWVTAQTPPCFLALAADDDTVPALPNGLALFAALHRAQVPAELHLFEHGGHGFALRAPHAWPCAHWPELFVAWARSRGFAG
jgi:acetyl esterase/lipase